MEYLTSYYRRQGESGCSLLLLQYLCRQTPVCFACICTAEGADREQLCAETVEKLKTWCRGVSWHKAAAHPGRWMAKLEKELTLLWPAGGRACPAVLSGGRAAYGEASAPGRLRLTLLLGIGRELLALGDGQNLLLVNTFLGAGKVTRLPGIFRGCIEPGAGLLLAAGGFLQGTEERSLAQALRLPEIRTAEQADRRLRELVKAGGKQPAESFEKQAANRESTAAVLLIAREGETGVHG